LNRRVVNKGKEKPDIGKGNRGPEVPTRVF
jgi:hypothetical protein